MVTLVEFLKLLGILFFIGMCWYFVYVVFDTNKGFLLSIKDEVDATDPEINFKKMMGGFFKEKEGFTFNKKYDEKQKSSLENILEKERSATESFESFLRKPRPSCCTKMIADCVGRSMII